MDRGEQAMSVSVDLGAPGARAFSAADLIDLARDPGKYQKLLGDAEAAEARLRLAEGRLADIAARESAAEATLQAAREAHALFDRLKDLWERMRDAILALDPTNDIGGFPLERAEGL
jgi:hypothetical protein